MPSPGSNNVLNCWLIDGVQTWDVYDTYYSQWMRYGTFPPVEPEEPDIIHHPENYVISDPVLVETNYFFRMNWGGDGNFDNTLYYYGDNWVVTDSQNRQCNFTNQRRMIYNIH